MTIVKLTSILFSSDSRRTLVESPLLHTLIPGTSNARVKNSDTYLSEFSLTGNKC